ncbi:hypothetical protein BJ165DRAFT_1374251, partial [Panaeolus papilionaceus]
MAPTKAALRINLAKGRAVLAEKKNLIQHGATVESLKNRLYNALEHTKELEAELEERSKVIIQLNTKITKLETSKTDLQGEIKTWKSKYDMTYHKYQMANQKMRRGLQKQDSLEAQVKLFEDVAEKHRKHL